MKPYKEQLNTILEGFPDYVFMYFNYCDGTLDRSTRTMIGYAYDIRTFYDFLIDVNPLLHKYSDINYDVLNKLTPVDLQEYMSYVKSYSKNGKQTQNIATSRARKLSCLRSFFHYLFTYGGLNNNPAKLIDSPRIHQKKKPRLDESEVNDLIDNVTNCDGITPKQEAYCKRSTCRDTAIILLFLYSGIRVSEMVNLDLDDVDDKNDTIKVIRKGGDEDIVYIPKHVIRAINHYIKFERRPFDDANRALFLSSRRTCDTRLTARSIERIIEKFTQNVTTKNVTPHTLRRTFGTQLQNETGDLYLTAIALGHKSIETSARHYVELKEEKKEKIRELKYNS